jgi:hypothetical protein
MKEINLTVSTLWLDEINIRKMFWRFSTQSIIRSTGEGDTRMFYLCLKDMSCSIVVESPFDQRSV